MSQPAAGNAPSPHNVAIDYLVAFITSGNSDVSPPMDDRVSISMALSKMILGYPGRKMDLETIRQRVQVREPETAIRYHFVSKSPHDRSRLLGLKIDRDRYTQFLPLHANGHLSLVSPRIPIPR